MAEKGVDIRLLKSGGGSAGAEVTYTAYSTRWLLLIAAFLLVVGIKGCWLSWNPISYQTAVFFGKEPSDITLFATVSFPCGVVMGIVTIWAFDKHGLYWPLIIGGWLCTIACGIRLYGVYTTPPSYTAVFVSQVTSAIGMPMLAMCSTKLAAVWFPEHETALANSLITSAMPIGVLLAHIMSPILVKTNDFTPGNFQTLVWIYAVPIIVGNLIMTATLPFKTGKPKTPANNAANVINLPFGESIRSLMTNRLYMITIISIGAGVGYFNVLMINAPLMMCPMGYSELYAKTLAMLILVVSGVSMSTVVGGVLTRYSDKIVIISKTLGLLMAFDSFAVAYTVTSPKEYISTTIALFILGASGLTLLPVSFELCVETTFPVGPATSSGIAWIFGQLLAAVFSIVNRLLGKPLVATDIKNTCKMATDTTTVENNYKVGMFALAGITWVLVIAWNAVYKCPFKRRNYESSALESTRQTATDIR